MSDAVGLRNYDIFLSGLKSGFQAFLDFVEVVSDFVEPETQGD